jgi:hypothetical protein
MRFPKHLPLVAALLCACVTPSFADQIVYFVNGKAIQVKSVEKGEKFSVLEMEGGGRIGVPTDQISRIEDYVVTEPAVAPQAPAPPPPPPVTSAAAQAVTPSVPLPLPTTQPGPGVGGRPAGGPGQSIAGLQPIQIGDPAPPEGPQRQVSRVGAANRGAASGPNQVRQQMSRPGAGRRPVGRPGVGSGRGAGRLSGMNPSATTPPASTGAPTEPSQTDPAAGNGSETEEPPPPPPDDSNEEPNEPAPQQDDSSGGTPGGPS